MTQINHYHRETVRLSPPSIPGHTTGALSFDTEPSTASALYSVFSRIIRPIWNREVVQKGIEDDWLPMIDLDDIKTIVTPLEKMTKLLKKRFHDATSNSCGNLRPPTEFEPRGGGAVGLSDQRYRDNQRYIYEKSELNTFYRLLTRTCQALDMIRILLEGSRDYRLNVKWAKLRNMTFYKMITDSTYHDSIKRFLKDFVCEQVLDLNNFKIIYPMQF